ncbi:MAG: hypothetical protein QOF61_3494, partial [Acidobacteriota bacterium]|nr:hypothetical protein [Acidobacteriota bacterium]
MRAARTQTSTQATPSIATLPAAARTATPARALTPAPPALRLGIAPAAGRGARAEGVAQLVSSPGGGDPLPAQVREALETGLGADLKAVRVHTDARAEAAAAALPARAFTYGTHIFLGAGARPTDLGLMAHEAAHVVQQGGAPVLQKAAEGEGDA